MEAYSARQVLNITSTNGTILLGALVTGGGVDPNTHILAQLSGPTGGPGEYLLSRQQSTTIAPTGLNMSTVMPIKSSQWTIGPAVTNQSFAMIAPSPVEDKDSWYVTFAFGRGQNGVTGVGIPFTTQDFTAISPWTGTISFDWAFKFFPEYIGANAYAAVLVNGYAVAILYNATGGGFVSASGTQTVNVVAGQSFGVRFGGANFDFFSKIAGSLTLSNLIPPASPLPLTIVSTLNGEGFTNFALTSEGATQATSAPYAGNPHDFMSLTPFGLLTTPGDLGGFQQSGSSMATYSHTIDLGQLRPVAHLRLTNNNAGGGSGGARNVRVEVSADNVTYTPAGSTKMTMCDMFDRYVFDI